MPIYAREGVAYIWLIDPDLQTLEAFELRGKQWVLLGAYEKDNPVSIASFDVIEFDLSVL